MATTTKTVNSMDDGLCSLQLTLDDVTGVIASVQVTNNAPDKQYVVTLTNQATQASIARTLPPQSGTISVDVSGLGFTWKRLSSAVRITCEIQ